MVSRSLAARIESMIVIKDASTSGGTNRWGMVNGRSCSSGMDRHTRHVVSTGRGRRRSGVKLAAESTALCEGRVGCDHL